MKAFIRILVASCLIFVLPKCSNTPEANEPTPPENLIQYTILNDTVSDTPLKTQVSMDLLMMKEDNEKITEQRIEDLLNYMFAKTMVRTGFQYSQHPTAVYIYLYTSEERAEAGMGQWLGMLDKGHSSDEPEISINERELNSLVTGGGTGTITDKRWGLSTDDRKEVWAELINLQDKAEKEAEAKYDISDPGVTIDEIGKYNQHYSDLNDKYKKELANSKGITVAIVDSIVKEGFKRSWTIPSRKK